MSDFAYETKLFPKALFTYADPLFESRKPALLEWLRSDDRYPRMNNRSSVHLTRPNLYKEPIFSDLVAWIKECFDDAYDRLGFEKNNILTSVWATRQRPGGYHHRHKHGNTFLAGAYYVHSDDPRPRGTRFFNENHQSIITPRRKKDSALWMRAFQEVPFVEGHMIVFPAWIAHDTPIHSEGDRFIVGVNSMPVGRTNYDVFDRYVYADTLDFTEDA